MQSEPIPRILAVDDEDSICRIINRLITKRLGFECDSFVDPEEALSAFTKNYYAAAILDVKMPKLDGLSLLTLIKEQDPDLPIIVLTAHGQWDTVVNAMRLGAFNFINKPFETTEVCNAITHAVEQYKISKELGSKNSLSNVHIIGKSPEIRRILELIKKVSPSDSTIMISGESGTGKELVARAIHLGSLRRHHPFVPVNCGAFPDTLLESELFGHVKGSFTSAINDKVGMFEVANKGTFFLDEIGETSQIIQVKLLRVIETREVRPVGSNSSRKFDTRIIAATNRNLEEEVKKGNFRFDLFYRLNVIPIQLPSLKDRKEDIPLLVGFFISRLAARINKQLTAANISHTAWQIIEDYSWPGNIRELENVIHRAFTLMSGDQIQPEDLGISILLQNTSGNEMVSGNTTRVEFNDLYPDFKLEKHLEDIEIEYLRRSLDRTDGNMTEAAKLLGLTFRTFRYKVRKYNLKNRETL